ncbi:hypothetical protein [Hymenobacter sp. BT559]|uniref:hypothetical protein n=1 Tax=Hymenobacter sp. BT559 TaxID=2795729 RepID=UPI0018ED22E9|nr:hypothetical protein [Hymenobacter sp. BT559]MBJ6146362.1 hypothetical protein [Hymenobacter sp. BT559]
MLRILPWGRAAATLGTLLLATACSKDKATPAPASSWQVEGQAQQSDKVVVEMGTPALNPNMLTVSIWQNSSTASANSSAVVLTLFVPNRVGTYSLGGTGTTTKASASYADYLSPGSGSNLYAATGGSITISSLTSNSVAGTFAFTGAELFNTSHTKQIIGGQFNSTF